MHCGVVNFQCIFRSKVLGTSLTLVAEAIGEVNGLDVVANLRPLGPALGADGAVVALALHLVSYKLVQILWVLYSSSCD